MPFAGDYQPDDERIEKEGITAVNNFYVLRDVIADVNKSFPRPRILYTPLENGIVGICLDPQLENPEREGINPEEARRAQAAFIALLEALNLEDKFTPFNKVPLNLDIAEFDYGWSLRARTLIDQAILDVSANEHGYYETIRQKALTAGNNFLDHLAGLDCDYAKTAFDKLLHEMNITRDDVAPRLNSVTQKATRPLAVKDALYSARFELEKFKRDFQKLSPAVKENVAEELGIPLSVLNRMTNIRSR